MDNSTQSELCKKFNTRPEYLEVAMRAEMVTDAFDAVKEVIEQVHRDSTSPEDYKLTYESLRNLNTLKLRLLEGNHDPEVAEALIDKVVADTTLEPYADAPPSSDKRHSVEEYARNNYADHCRDKDDHDKAVAEAEAEELAEKLAQEEQSPAALLARIQRLEEATQVLTDLRFAAKTFLKSLG